VASPSTRRKDRVIKFDKYAEAGIPGYWRVELDPITVVAHALGDGGYVEVGSFSEGQTVTVDEPISVRFDPGALLPWPTRPAGRRRRFVWPRRPGRTKPFPKTETRSSVPPWWIC
jgi:hypothetical protein